MKNLVNEFSSILILWQIVIVVTMIGFVFFMIKFFKSKK